MLVDDLWKTLSNLKDMNPTDELLKPAIIEAVSKELKNSTDDIGIIEEKLSNMQQEELMSAELLTWAVGMAKNGYRQMLEANADIRSEPRIEHRPVALDHDDLYHASLCSTVVNTPNGTEQCKRLLQSLSYKSVKELSLSQPNDATFPKCMIAISSDGDGATTCYVAFENVIDYNVRKVFDDDKKVSFGKGTTA